MMKRIAAALAALVLFAAPAHSAHSGRVLVIRSNAAISTETSRGLERQLAATTAVLEALGCEYDVVNQQTVAGTPTNPSENVQQAALRTGTVRFGVGAGSFTRQYGLMIHMNFWISSPMQVPGYRPDSLTRNVATMWPDIPHIFLGTTVVIGGSLYSNATGCTTGVKAAGGVTTSPDNGPNLSMRALGTDYIWKNTFYSGHTYYVNTTTQGLAIDRSTRDRVVRARVIVGASSAIKSLNPRGLSGDAFPDSMSNPEFFHSTPLADTALIWTQERTIGDTAVMIFCLPGWLTQSSLQLPMDEVAISIAIADSAVGGAIIGQADGWKPKAMGVVVSGAFTRSESDTNSQEWSSHGTQLSTMNDSSLVKAGIDSLNSLGIPILVTVNIDSVAAFPYEKAWWLRLRQARFSPESRVGTGINLTGAAVNADRYHSPDIFGYKRERAIITTDRYDNGTVCDGTDTTLSCLLEYSRFRLDSIPEFKGRLSRTLVAPHGDYIPRQAKRSYWPSEDSLIVAMNRAGFDAGVFLPINSGTLGSGSTFNSASGFIGQDAQAPYVHRKRIGRYPTKDHVGEFAWLAARHIDENSFYHTGLVNNHPMSQEFIVGFFQSPWYPDDLNLWLHQFKTKLNVVIIRPGDLGFQAESTTNVTRMGYWQVRWVVNQLRAVNHFAGREVFTFAYPEDIEP